MWTNTEWMCHRLNVPHASHGTQTIAYDGAGGLEESLSIADVSVLAPERGFRNLVCVVSSSSRLPLPAQHILPLDYRVIPL